MNRTRAAGSRSTAAPSFHGTHVAGIAAGDAGTTAPAGADHPATPGLSGVAPRAWIGNYRVFNAPTPIGHVANTPEIVAAFEAAVADGMDVINFSGGGPETDPANDAMVEAIRNVTAAGVVAGDLGRERPRRLRPRLGRLAGHGARRDLGRGRLERRTSSRPRSTSSRRRADDAARHPVPRSAGGPRAGGLGQRDQTLVDVGSLVGTDGRPVDRAALRARVATRTARRGTIARAARSRAPSRSSAAATCTFVSKAPGRGTRARSGVVVIDNRPGEANVIPAELQLPAGMIADLDGDRLHAYLAARGGRAAVRIGRDAARARRPAGRTS